MKVCINSHLPERPHPTNFMFQILILAAILPSDNGFCPSGSYKSRHGSGMDYCPPCTDGETFMPHKDHNFTQCKNCTRISKPEVEVIIHPCNLKNDTDIQCIEGFYRKKSRNGRDSDQCLQCTPSCGLQAHVTRPCKNFTDTLCCHENYEAVQITDDVFQCKELPIRCKQGQYYNKETEQCLPCGAGFYMPDNDHQQLSCLRCKYLENSVKYKSTVFSRCSVSSPTIFGCQEGFYRTLNSLVFEEMECKKCTECEEETTQPCNNYTDTVCQQSCEALNCSRCEGALPSTSVTQMTTTFGLPQTNNTCPSAEGKGIWSTLVISLIAVFCAIVVFAIVGFFYEAKIKICLFQKKQLPKVQTEETDLIFELRHSVKDY